MLSYNSYGFFIFRKKGKNLELLLLKASETSSLPFEYSIVKGAPEENEMPIDTCLRETYEEVKFTKSFLQILPIPPLKYEYYVTKNEDYVIKSVTAYFSYLSISRKPILSAEHIDYQFFTEKELQKSSIPEFLKLPYLKAFSIINQHT